MEQNDPIPKKDAPTRAEMETMAEQFMDAMTGTILRLAMPRHLVMHLLGQFVRFVAEQDIERGMSKHDALMPLMRDFMAGLGATVVAPDELPEEVTDALAAHAANLPKPTMQ